MPKGTKPIQFSGELQQHFEAFCHSFLITRVRDRKVDKPAEFLNDCYHKLDSYVQPKCMIELAGSWSSNPAPLFRHITKQRTCACFAPPSTAEIRPIENVMLDQRLCDGMVLSFEPGALAHYEGEPFSRKFLLISDERRRNAVRAMLFPWQRYDRLLTLDTLLKTPA